MPDGRELDLVLLGATGYSGALVAGYLSEAAPPSLRIGLAGRSRERLEAARDELGPPAAEWPLLHADLDNPASLAALARSARVVATAAGPYSGRGLPLVEACVDAGTDYVDFTGEVLFIRDSADRCHDRAAAAGVRVVHACGVDSIPSDLGVLLLAERATADGAGELGDTLALVRAFGGGVSGGSLATVRRQLEEMRGDAGRRRLVADPYALSPDRAREPERGRERDLRRVAWDRRRRLWLAPFVMAGINTRVVRRSNALQVWRYGRRFRYGEALAFPDGASGFARAAASTAGLGALAAALLFPPARPLVDRVLPAPGEGPDAERRASGRFELEIGTVAASGRPYLARVAAAGAGAYTVSARLLAESALCLALDREALPDAAGVLTPATGLGTALAERLRRAGVTLTVAG